MGQAYHDVAVKHGSLLSVTEIGDRFGRAFDQSETDSFPGGPDAQTPWLTSDAIERARWRWIVSQVVPDVDDPDACFEELWQHFTKPTSWVCFDDVATALVTFQRQGYRLAIASNFDSRLHAICDQEPALQPIEKRFVSSETGFRKPSPGFYAAVIEQCGGQPNQILMVGDDPQHDVSAARSAGLHAVLIDRRVSAPKPGSIQTLEDLLP